MPESEIKTLLPLPKMVIGILSTAREPIFAVLTPSSRCRVKSDDCVLKNCSCRCLEFFFRNFNTLISWRLVVVWIKISVGPPILRVVRGARGKSFLISRLGKLVKRS